MKNALALLQLIPTIIAIITSLEAFLPKDGAGKQKMELLKNMLSTASDTLTELWPAIEKIVAMLVNAANSLGVFKKNDPPVA